MGISRYEPGEKKSQGRPLYFDWNHICDVGKTIIKNVT
jgi:hypothetical protein